MDPDLGRMGWSTISAARGRPQRHISPHQARVILLLTDINFHGLKICLIGNNKVVVIFYDINDYAYSVFKL